MGTKEQLKEERDRIVIGLEETYKRLIEYKKQKNSPMIVVRNGKIEAVDPNEILPTSGIANKGFLGIRLMLVRGSLLG